MSIRRYFGSGPYCYTNTLLSALNRTDLNAATLETLTGSPFGVQLLFGTLPLVDPFGWTPDLGLDQALTLLGYTWKQHLFQEDAQAMTALQAQLKGGPVFIGPLDMGWLRHQPDSERASGADHFVTVLELQGGLVYMHDPQGHPWAALPVEAFLQAWQAERIGYGRPYSMRTDFQHLRDVGVHDALRSSTRLAAQWARGRGDLPTPPGTLGGALAWTRLADQVEQEFSDDLRGMLIQFSLRIGARRKADGAASLHDIGMDAVARVLQQQARILGSLQYPATIRDLPMLAAGFRQLSVLHLELIESLDRAVQGH